MYDCVRNESRSIELTRVVYSMSVKATLEAFHRGCLNYTIGLIVPSSDSSVTEHFSQIFNLDIRLNILYL